MGENVSRPQDLQDRGQAPRVVVMAMAEEDLLNGERVLVKLQEVGNQSLPSAGVKQKITPLSLEVSRKTMFPDSAPGGNRIFTNDCDPTGQKSSSQ